MRKACAPKHFSYWNEETMVLNKRKRLGLTVTAFAAFARRHALRKFARQRDAATRQEKDISTWEGEGGNPAGPSSVPATS